MNRRIFLTSALASFACKYSATSALAEVAMDSSHLPQRLVDLHCHIFNADDLPIDGFIRKVIIPANKELRSQFRDFPDAFEALIKILSSLMKDEAPSPAQEIALLGKIQAGLAAAPTAAERRARDLRVVRKLVDIIWSHQVPNGLSFEDGFVFNVATEKLQQLILEEIFSRFFCCGAGRDEIQAVPLDDVTVRLHDSNGTIGRNVRWALLFTRNRFELADGLQSFHGGKAVLATPALIDFSKWLQDDNISDLKLQVAVMGKIAKRKTGIRIHPFMAFDPLREALHRNSGGPEADSPLSLVKQAVAAEGFIGVKLYPPMGFRAFNNAGAGDDFPSHVRRALGNEPGKKLDDILGELFTWCAASHVPVMAHAANTNAAGPGFGTRANPSHWISLLKQPGLSDLRINLAHFGGFEEGGSYDKSWERSIANFWQRSPAAFLYADISYFSEILQSDTDKRKRLVANWKKLRAEFPQSADRLIYGSDWVMLGREQGVAPIDVQAHKRYSALVADFLNNIGYTDDNIENIMWRNSARFLGLGVDERVTGTRGRLEKFNQTEGINSSWLDSFGT